MRFLGIPFLFLVGNSSRAGIDLYLPITGFEKFPGFTGASNPSSSDGYFNNRS